MFSQNANFKLQVHVMYVCQITPQMKKAKEKYTKENFKTKKLKFHLLVSIRLRIKRISSRTPVTTGIQKNTLII